MGKYWNEITVKVDSGGESDEFENGENFLMKMTF